MLNIKQCKKVNHSKDTFWYNFIVTDLLKIEPLLRIKRWRGGGCHKFSTWRWGRFENKGLFIGAAIKNSIFGIYHPRPPPPLLKTGPLGFLIGLKYETIIKIANNIQQFPAEIIQRK
jgi:hypothetical protein